MIIVKELKSKKQSGFTMIEVLVTLVIMAIGLLGIAAMQILGMKNNHSAYLRTQVTTLANQYADILRSNPTEVKNNKFVADGASFLTSDTPPTATASCTTTTGCTTSQMAETDLANWITNVQELPSGNAIVKRSGDIYSVRIFWLDERNKDDADKKKIDIDDVDNDNDFTTGTDDNTEGYKIFVTSFQP